MGVVFFINQLINRLTNQPTNPTHTPKHKHSGTVLEAKDYAVSGSGASYIVGYLDLNYPNTSSSSEGGEEEKLGRGQRHKALSRQECEEVVQRALALAVGRDSHSGAFI
jgi:20S proteasome alpha/beta subunit